MIDENSIVQEECERLSRKSDNNTTITFIDLFIYLTSCGHSTLKWDFSPTVVETYMILRIKHDFGMKEVELMRR